MSPLAQHPRNASILATATLDQAEGLLELRLTTDPRGRSVIVARRQRFPLRMTVPFYFDHGAPDMAFVYVQNPTGGVFAGDRLLTRVRADRDVRLHLTTQSATKLYRAEGAEARHEMYFELSPGAYVESMPDPLIPQAGARYRQHVRVELAEGGTFLAAETIAPGRRARGERFDYELLELTTEVRRGGRELCCERLRLEPALAHPARPGVLGEADYLVSVLVVAPEADSAALAAAIDVAVADDSEVRGAAGELPRGGGVLARILAPDATSARRSLSTAWATVRSALFGLPLPERRK